MVSFKQPEPYKIPAQPYELAQRIADRLGAIEGIQAVVLGGSLVRGAADAKSDVDLGIYYDPAHPPSLESLRELAGELDERRGEEAVTAFGEWGPWINGGAWLEIEGRRVDWLYRDLAKVRHVIDECLAGRPVMVYQTGHPHGFSTAIYMGEVALCVPLFQRDDVITDLKKLTIPYPPALKKALITNHLWEAGFALDTSRKSASRGDVFHVTGGLFRCAACLMQVLFALNERYCLNEKGSISAAALFPLAPQDFAETVVSVLAQPGDTPAALTDSLLQFDSLVVAVRELVEDD